MNLEYKIIDNKFVNVQEILKTHFQNSVILNDYNSFIDKTCHIILGKMK